MIPFPPSIGFDVETTGTGTGYSLQPFRALVGEGKITAASFARDDKAAGLLYPKASTVANVIEAATRDELCIVGWNVSFDAAWAIAVGAKDVVMEAKWLDAMLLWRHWCVEPEGEDVPAHKRKSFALAAALKEFFPENADFKEFKDFDATDEKSLELLLERNKGDALFTLKLAELFWSKLNDRQRRAALIEAQCIPMVANTKVIGIKSDPVKAEALSKMLEAEAVTLELELLRVAPDANGVNFGSPKQLQTLLFETWGLPIQGRSRKTELPSTDKYALAALAVIDPRVKLIKQLREAKNNRTKYAKATLKSIAYNGDGCVRPSPKIFSTYCVPGTVEVLTREGWVSLDSWGDGGEIMQYSPGRDELEFLPATRFIGPVVDKWIRFENLGCNFTEGHTIPYRAQKTKRFKTLCAGEIFSKYKSSFDVPIAAKMRSKVQGTVEGLLKVQILAMAQADGWFSKDGFLKFTFKKDRKVVRCQELLEIAHIDHRVRVWPSYPDRTEITIPKREMPTWLSKTCKKLGPWLFNYSYSELYMFVEELVHWDGHKNVDGGVDYSTNIRSNAEWVHTIAHLVGRKAGMHKVQAGGMYSVHISDENIVPVRSVKPNRHGSVVSKPSRAYCAKTETGFWLARSEGKIFITGNTGRMSYSSQDKVKGLVEKTTKAKGTHFVEQNVQLQTGIALHQWKRGKEFRDLICAPEGYSLTEFDFAGQEFRWMAVASEDQTMLSLCAEGEDAHSFMGAQVAGVKYRDLMDRVALAEAVAENQRKAGKFCNLSYQYRVSAKTATKKAQVDYGLDVQLPFIQHTQAIYKQAYPGVEDYWARQILAGKVNRYAETFAGRRVQLPSYKGGRHDWGNDSTAINYPIQGTGGDQKYLALAVARNYLPQFGGVFYFELHDGLFFLFPDDKVDAAIPFFRNLLSNLPYKQAWGVNLPIAFPVDSKKGKSWGDLKEVF